MAQRDFEERLKEWIGSHEVLAAYPTLDAYVEDQKHAAFEAGSRSRDAEVEALKQERNEYQFDAQVAFPELREYADRLRESLRDVLEGIDSTAGTPSREVKRLARAWLEEDG